MSEPTEAPKQDRIPADVLFNVVGEIATKLEEPNKALLRRIVIVLGVERAQKLLEEVLAIEAEGGRMTLDGTRRKTPGGLFITLARAQASPEEKPRLFDLGPKKPKPKAAQPESGTEAPKPTPISPLTWEEAKQLISQAVQTIGEARTVKITLIGRPGRVVEQTNCVVVAMKGKEPPSLPKGLPTPPANSAVTWAVFIATKQWTKVKDSLHSNQEDQLIIEGYPLIDPKSQASVVLALSVKSVAMERASREEKKAGQ